MPKHPKKAFLAVLMPLLLIGCAAPGPYRLGNPIETPYNLAANDPYPQIEEGRPVFIVDKVGHYLISLPSKLLLWNWKMDNHVISSATETALRDYIEVNKLKNVKVRLNQYAPGGEWRRLVKNKEVGAGWRYTLGVISCVEYTILPGRFFAGLLTSDEYNPYTNTINLYSDLPVVGYHEGGHAKDFAETKWKGSYAATRILPLAPLYQEYVASRDAIGYTYYCNNSEEEQEAYKILYPAMGTYVAGEAVDIIKWFYPLTIAQEYLIQAGAVVSGHAAGRTAAAINEKPPDK